MLLRGGSGPTLNFVYNGKKRLRELAPELLRLQAYQNLRQIRLTTRATSQEFPPVGPSISREIHFPFVPGNFFDFPGNFGKVLSTLDYLIIVTI